MAIYTGTSVKAPHYYTGCRWMLSQGVAPMRAPPGMPWEWTRRHSHYQPCCDVTLEPQHRWQCQPWLLTLHHSIQKRYELSCVLERYLCSSNQRESKLNPVGMPIWLEPFPNIFGTVIISHIWSQNFTHIGPWVRAWGRDTKMLYCLWPELARP